MGKSEVKSKEHDGTWTYTTILEEATFTRAVMTMAFDYSEADKPKKENDWYLADNPCWPKHIVPDDPGFVLLTDDKWYGTHQFPQGYDASKTKALYADDPPHELVQQAELRQKQSGEQGSGDKRGHSPDSSDGNQKRSERLELVDEVLVIRDGLTNSTRELTEVEFRGRVEVIQCSDRACVKERKELGGGHDLVFVPGAGPPSRPAENLAIPTVVTLSTSLVEVTSETTLSIHPHPRETGSSSAELD